MHEAEATSRPDAGGADPPRPRAERIGRPVWWLGLVTSVLVAGGLSIEAYSAGLSLLFDRVPQSDKAFHFGVGGALAFFLDGVLRRRMLRVGSVALPAAAVLLLVPAGIEEYLQRYSINRTPSFADFAADVLGVTFFVWLSRRVG